MAEAILRGIMNGKNILSRHANNSWGCIPLTVIDSTTAAQAVTLPDGRKYLPAGLVVGNPQAVATAQPMVPAEVVDPSAGTPDAIGVLFTDVLLDSTTNQGTGPVLMYGFVNIKALPGETAPSAAIQAKIPRITFETVRG